MRHTRTYFVYLLASKPQGTLYIGVTNDLMQRVAEHREGKASAFTRHYNVTQLVWYETFIDVHTAIQRETSLKRWRRDWKMNLIERENLNWVDLFPTLPQNL